MGTDVPRRVCAALGLMAAAAVGAASADVVTDGTAGPRVRLGGDFEIGADLGRQAGGNLFHSFERFSLDTGERATFSGPDAIRNVISRVTGGARSDIDGTIRSTIPGADFYFLNPAGVMFGPNATLDVAGSFHVSTADELRFDDGATYGARDPSPSSFTVAAPEAFGFLGAEPAPLSVDRSRLSVPAGEALSLVGGDLTITAANNGSAGGGEDGTVRAEAGRITLAALGGPGEAPVADGGVTATEFADILLTNQALVDASGDGGGVVRIRGGRLVMDNQSFIFADNTGPTDARGGITVDAEAVVLGSGANLTTDVFGAGRGGPLAIRAAELEVREGSQIRSDTLAEGDAGTVTVEVDQVLVSREGAEFFSQISSSTRFGASGDAGAVRVTADKLEVRDGGEIFSSTFGEGDAGSVTVEANEILVAGDTGLSTILSAAARGSSGDAGVVTVSAANLELRGGGIIISDTLAEGDAGMVTVEADRLFISDDSGSKAFTGIGSRARDGSSGAAGTVRVTAGELEVRGGSEISSGAFAEGDAGTVIVEAERLLIVGDGSARFAGIQSQANRAGAAGAAGAVTVRADELEIRRRGAISSATFGEGDAGSVTVEAGELRIIGDDSERFTGIASATASESTGAGGSVTVTAPVMLLANGGQVAAFSRGTGTGGSVVVRASDTLQLMGGRVTAETAAADAGDITIVAGRLIDLRDSEITTSAAAGRGSGGNILVDPKFIVLDASRVVANAREGAGGNIRIVADNLIASPDSIVDASSDFGIDGNVQIDAPDREISGELVVLQGTLLDAGSLLRERCPARRDIGASSFVGVGRGGLPPSPDAPLAGASLSEAPALALERGAEEVADAQHSGEGAIGAAVAGLAPCHGAW